MPLVRAIGIGFAIAPVDVSPLAKYERCSARLFSPKVNAHALLQATLPWKLWLQQRPA